MNEGKRKKERMNEGSWKLESGGSAGRGGSLRNGSQRVASFNFSLRLNWGRGQMEKKRITSLSLSVLKS